MTIYHVAKNGAINHPGTEAAPFLQIQQAAEVAMAGDIIYVHQGEYREWVKPRNSGLSHNRSITYQAVPGEKVVIKGSEIVTDWEKVEGTVWKKVIPNEFFNGFNPFKEALWGDWLTSTADRQTHLGEVYLNGQALYEATSLEGVKEPIIRETVQEFFVWVDTPERYPERMKYVWFAEVTDKETTIFANFQTFNPNQELVEINVRPACFYPEVTGMDYITLRGFEICQAACPWTPPSGDQPGMIGPRWSKGWLIEDNVIHDAKCSAISIGKVADSGDNFYTRRFDKPGYTYQLESVFKAVDQGWSKERIGSHVIRRNHIYDCGQNGIVGHLGGVFSEIYDNHIHDISMKREFYGWEIAGIKMHGAIDVQLYNNRIHDCSCGTWLDWQTQGIRVSKNIFHDNGLDLFIEVSHGPYLVDNNILASKFSLRNMSQGGAYVNNLFAGNMDIWDVRDRATPYHLPHSTKVRGYAVVYGGDDRYYNNIFCGQEVKDQAGTAHYNGSHTSLEDYITEIKAFQPADLEKFMEVRDPVYINNNLYLNQAQAFEQEKDYLQETNHDGKIKIMVEEDQVRLAIDLPESFTQLKPVVQTTQTLGRTRISDMEYENPNGEDLVIDTDLLDKPMTNRVGPLQILNPGENLVEIWHK